VPLLSAIRRDGESATPVPQPAELWSTSAIRPAAASCMPASRTSAA